MKLPKRSPWGIVYSCREVAQGIVWVSTASHGGIKLDPVRQRQMPRYLRSEGGWYEEDCEWAKVYAVFVDAIEDAPIRFQQAAETFKRWFPDEYNRFYQARE